MSLLRELINDGTIPLLHFYNSGCAYDFSGNGNSGSLSSGIRWAGGSIRFPNTTDEITIADSSELRVASGSLLIFSQYGFTSQSATQAFINKHNGAAAGYLFDATATLLRLRGGSTVTLAASILGYKSVGVTFSSGATPEGYLDGLSAGSFSGNVVITSSTVDLEIGNAGNAYPCESGLTIALEASRILTATEMAQLHAELLSIKWPTKYFSHAKRPQIANLLESGIIAGWDMKPVSGEVVDSVGGFNGTNYGSVYESGILGDRMRFDGTDDYVDCGNVGTVKSVAFTVNPTTTTEEVIDLDGGTHSIEVVSGTVTATGWTAPTIYVDGVASTALIAGKQQRIVVTTATGIAASAVQLGTETGFLEGTLGDVELFSDEKSAAWVARDYLDIAKAVQFKTDWAYQESPANEGGTLHQQIGGNGSPFRAGDTTGRFKIETDTVDGELCKVLTCTTAGEIYIDKSFFFDCTPTEAMYGTFLGWMYKPDAAAITWKLGGTDFDCTANGYGVVWAADESVVVSELGVGIVVSGGTATADTWHRFDTTRAGDGGFVGYVDETSYGTGSDTTTTTSVGMAWSMGVGCKIVLESARAKGPSGITKMLGVVPPLT